MDLVPGLNAGSVLDTSSATISSGGGPNFVRESKLGAPSYDVDHKGPYALYQRCKIYDMIWNKG